MKVISWRCATSCARVGALCEPCESPSMGVPVRDRLGGLCHQASVTNRSGFRWLLCLLSSLVLCIWVISWKKVRIHDLRFVVLIKQLLREEKENVNIEYTSCFYATYYNRTNWMKWKSLLQSQFQVFWSGSASGIYFHFFYHGAILSTGN